MPIIRFPSKPHNLNFICMYTNSSRLSSLNKNMADSCLTLVDNQEIESLSERFMAPEIEITAVIVRNLSSVERKVLCAVMEVVSQRMVIKR